VASTALDEVTDWIGEGTLDDQAILDVLDRFDGDVLLAARSILRRRLASFVMAPAELSVDQDYSRKVTKDQLAVLERLISDVSDESGEVDPDELPTLTTGLLTRDAPGR
jgi:hypothetical protein